MSLCDLETTLLGNLGSIPQTLYSLLYSFIYLLGSVSLGCLGTHFVDQPDLELTEIFMPLPLSTKIAPPNLTLMFFLFFFFGGGLFWNKLAKPALLGRRSYNNCWGLLYSYLDCLVNSTPMKEKEKKKVDGGQGMSPEVALTSICRFIHIHTQKVTVGGL